MRVQETYSLGCERIDSLTAGHRTTPSNRHSATAGLLAMPPRQQRGAAPARLSDREGGV